MIVLLIMVVVFSGYMAKWRGDITTDKSKITPLCQDITINNNKAVWSKAPCNADETEQTIISDSTQHPGEYCCAKSS